MLKNPVNEFTCHTMKFHHCHHADKGCPVLVGSKWILNKWIRANDQGLMQKCLLTKTKTKSNDLFTQFRNLS